MKEVVQLLQQTERRLLDHARELRQARTLLQRELSSRGALGSRGLTQFLLDQLRAAPARRLTVTELQRRAESAGYAVPNHSALTSRLSEFARRTGKVDSVRGEGWGWLGEKKAEEDEEERGQR